MERAECKTTPFYFDCSPFNHTHAPLVSIYRKKVRTIYEKFERLLEERSVTAYRVAEETGLPRSMFSDWKNGKYTPKVDKIMKIAKYFGVGLDYFYDE